MRGLVAGALITVALLAVFVQQSSQRHAQERGELLQQLHDAVAATQIALARYAESATTVQRTTDTVRVRLEHYDTLRSVLNVHDTVNVWAYVHAADSMANSCQDLANACERFHRIADSTIAATGRERDAYKNLYNATRDRWWKRFGITAGYGLSKDGARVFAGPQVGLSFRVWP